MNTATLINNVTLDSNKYVAAISSDVDRREYKANWYQENKERIQVRENEYRNMKYRTDPKFRFDRQMHSLFTRILKGEITRSRKLEKLMGYSVTDIRNHIQSLFTGLMKWSNYGLFWELDHEISKSIFLLEDYKLCWSLDNLRPLLVEQNRFKRNN